MKDSIHLANMLRRFTREKAEIRKKNPAIPAAAVLPRPNPKVPNANNSAVLNAHPKTAGATGNDFNMTDLTTDPAMCDWLIGSANNNNDMLQDMMGDLDFGMLDSPQPSSPAQGENGLAGAQHKPVAGRVSQGGVLSPPPLPSGLPAPLAKRIEDLRAVRNFCQFIFEACILDTESVHGLLEFSFETSAHVLLSFSCFYSVTGFPSV